MLSAEELSDLGADSAYTAHIESDLNCRLAAKKQYMAESSAIGANSVNTRLNRGSRLSSEATVSCVSCSFVLLPQPRFCPAKEGTARGSPGRPIARGRGRSWGLGPTPTPTPTFYTNTSTSDISSSNATLYNSTITMTAKSQRESEQEVRSWGFPHAFTWTDGPYVCLGT